MIYGWLLLAVLIIWGLCEFRWFYNEVKEWVIGQYLKGEKLEITLEFKNGQLALDEDILKTLDLDREDLEKEREELLEKLVALKQERFVREKGE